MLSCRTCDDPRLRQHVSAASRFQLHLVHEVLYTVAIENAITIDKQHEEVIVSAEIILVYSVDEAERLLLAASLAAMREPRDSNAAATVGDVDTSGEGIQCNGNTELLNGPQVKLILILAIERQENMEAAWRVLAVGD